VSFLGSFKSGPNDLPSLKGPTGSMWASFKHFSHNSLLPRDTTDLYLIHACLCYDVGLWGSSCDWEGAPANQRSTCSSCNNSAALSSFPKQQPQVTLRSTTSTRKLYRTFYTQQLLCPLTRDVSTKEVQHLALCWRGRGRRCGLLPVHCWWKPKGRREEL